MKAYIQTLSNGEYYNVNAFVAATGFRHFGFEIIPYTDSAEVQEPERDAIFVGGVGMVRKRLEQLGIAKEDEIEYPAELHSFLNRKVWTSTLQEVITAGETGIFIKPMKTKLFPGKVIHGFKDFIGLNFADEVQVWCSEAVEVLTEWRCFVRYGQLLDVRYYKGRWDQKLDLDIVEKAIAAYSSQPAAYCLDFGIDEKGNYYLIEVNDGHSLGTYGMGAVSYAKFLSARWSELTSTTDALRF